MNLEELMKSVMEQTEEAIEAQFGPMPPTEDQEATIRDFNKPSPIKVGDRVKRNKYGQARYKFPLNENQVGIITRVFDTPMMDEQGKLSTGELTVTFPDGDAVPHPVDLRCYDVF